MENKTAEDLALAIKSLPDEQRQAFIMRDAMNMDYADIAEAIGTSEEEAQTLVTQARGSVADFSKLEESAS